MHILWALMEELETLWSVCYWPGWEMGMLRCFFTYVASWELWHMFILSWAFISCSWRKFLKYLLTNLRHFYVYIISGLWIFIISIGTCDPSYRLSFNMKIPVFWVTYITIHFRAGSISFYLVLSAWIQSSLPDAYRNRYMIACQRNPL